MDATAARGDFDRAIGALASKQYGIVTRAQLVELGMGRGAVASRLGKGRLQRVHTGVYAVGHRAPRHEARWLAAVLACGADALLSHRSAASLWRIRRAEGPRPDVTIATRNGRRRPGIAVHRAQLGARDIASHAGIPVTSPERTLADLAREIDHADLVRALREAQYLRRFDLAVMNDVLARRPCRPLRVLVGDLVLAQSGLEDLLLEICDRCRIERPLTQRVVLGRRVDFLWPRERVIVETDGWEGHGTRSAFQADRAASNAWQVAGYRVLRFTDADLKRHPDRVAREIASALGDART